MKKPDLIMRHHPMSKVLPAMQKLRRVILFHPDPIVAAAPRQRCFCGTKSNEKMLLCEPCLEWYHFGCIGVNAAEAAALIDWRCGYCRTEPDGDGLHTWGLEIPQGKRKRLKTAEPRAAAQTPRALGVEADGDDMVDAGPTSWDEIVEIVTKLAKVLRAKEIARKKAATKIVKEGGHHVVDAMSFGGVSQRPVDNQLVDDFVGQDLINDADLQLEDVE